MRSLGCVAVCVLVFLGVGCAGAGGGATIQHGQSRVGIAWRPGADGAAADGRGGDIVMSAGTSKDDASVEGSVVIPLRAAVSMLGRCFHK